MSVRICVFCGSGVGRQPAYAAAAICLAKHLVSRKIGIVYGGSNAGLMRVLSDAALEAHGEVIGVMPQVLVAKERAHTELADLRVVSSMHERKALMAELSDAFIALPGGYGTFEEFCEMLTWTQLGIHRKPCGLLNVEGYYDGLLKVFDHAMEEQFLRPAHRQMVIADSRPELLVERLLSCQLPSEEKWLDVKQS